VYWLIDAEIVTAPDKLLTTAPNPAKLLTVLDMICTPVVGATIPGKGVVAFSRAPTSTAANEPATVEGLVVIEIVPGVAVSTLFE
jgi:hypothetical protein